MVTGTVTLNLALTDVELTLVAAAVNDRIAALDATIAKLRAQVGDAPDSWSLLYENEEIHRLMRARYAAIVRRIEQLLEVPFISSVDAREALEAGTVVVGR